MQSPEIEITAEMIEAGAQELNGDVVDDLRDGTITRWAVVETVFRAMLRVSRATQST